MNTLLFAVTAIAALSMLAPGSGTAEPTHPNEVGLYTETADGYGATGTYVIGTPVDVFLVLTKPTDTENGGPFQIPPLGFECTLNFNPIGNLFFIGDSHDVVDYINIGDTSRFDEGFLEYIVGFSEPAPEIEESVLLMTLTFIHTAQGVIEVNLGPPVSYEGWFPGQMSFQVRFPDIPNYFGYIMYSMGSSHDAPVFMFGGEAVPAETESFGSVKALYR